MSIEHVFPTLEVMQKMAELHHDKLFDMWKNGYTLPKFTSICLPNSNTAKYYYITESDKVLFEKLLERMDGEPSFAFNRKVFVDEILDRDSGNWCKTIAGYFASKLCVYSMCQTMP